MAVVPHDPDFDIIDQVLGGDQDAFAQLVDRHKGFAYTIAFRVLGTRGDAEEAAQDGFLKAYRSLARFGRQSKFSTWLYRIVFNTAISYKRKQKFMFASLEKADALHADKDVTFEGEDRSRFIHEALKQVNEADRLALELFYLKELSMEEIAEITGQNMNTLKVRIHRARQRLARELKTILKGEALTL